MFEEPCYSYENNLPTTKLDVDPIHDNDRNGKTLKVIRFQKDNILIKHSIRWVFLLSIWN